MNDRVVKKGHKPSEVFADLGLQFRNIFKEGCKKLKIELEHSPKHYPQSKGKEERYIRTFNEEFLRLGEVFDSIDGLLSEFVHRYNFDRPHMGIGGLPAALYFNIKDVTHAT